MTAAAARSAPPAAARILVVEDNAALADGLRYNLELEGFDVAVAADGHAALRLAHERPPDLVVLDLMLPGLDGFQTRQRFAEAGLENCYFVAMTGFGNSDDKRRTRAAGFDAHLTKPVELDILVTLLNEAQERSGKAAATGGVVL